MQFDDAILAAKRLAAEGRGAEDHVILAALVERLVQLEEQLAALTRECNIRQDGVLLLSEVTKNQLRILRNRDCQIDGLLDAMEAQIFDMRKRIPPKKARPKVKDTGPIE